MDKKQEKILRNFLVSPRKERRKISKKGQGLSLNVIIVAALALIVLVVLIMVFTGKIGVFDRGVSQESKAELIKMKIQYGDCQPKVSTEEGFISNFEQVENVDQRQQIKDDFIQEIDYCKSFDAKSDCERGECRWS